MQRLAVARLLLVALCAAVRAPIIAASIRCCWAVCLKYADDCPLSPRSGSPLTPERSKLAPPLCFSLPACSKQFVTITLPCTLTAVYSPSLRRHCSTLHVVVAPVTFWRRPRGLYRSVHGGHLICYINVLCYISKNQEATINRGATGQRDRASDSGMSRRCQQRTASQSRMRSCRRYQQRTSVLNGHVVPVTKLEEAIRSYKKENYIDRTRGNNHRWQG
jgi:hypothetical protein